MSDFKEFQSKNLDQAIQDACTFFGTEREKLEIEIIEDAKMGVFGIIGARKARIRARLVSLPEFSMPQDEHKKQKPFGRQQKPKNRPAQDKFENLEKKVRQEKLVSGYDDEEEGESQKRFLAKMQTPHDHRDDEELDERQLEAMDREAMQRANFLGNMTEAEIIAGGHYEQDNNGRYHRTRNFRGQNRRFDRDGFDRAGYEKPAYEKNAFDKAGYDKPYDRSGYDKGGFEKKGKYRKFDRQDKNAHFDRNERPRFEKSERKPRFAKRPYRGQNEMQAKPEYAEYEGVQLPKVNLLELDQEKLISTVRETISQLIRPIVGDNAPIEITVEENRVLAKVESEDSGLLIGREGQHLAAVQYLAARIITTKMQVQVRIQLDTGDYHQRQDERMQSLAHMLADRLRKTGRSQSTRPMSAYQRRVIHLALQDEPDVQTRSVGEGVLKRVIIMKKRNDFNEIPEELTADQDQFEDDVFMADEAELAAETAEIQENKE